MTAPPGSGLRMRVALERNGFRLEAALEAGSGVTVLFGPSGVGKSTLLQAVAGLVTPQVGEIHLGDRTLFRRLPQGKEINVPTRRRRVGYVLQSYALFPHLSALENVAYPLRRRPDRRERARELLERMALGGFGDRLPHELSGGQQQRVAIARALAAEPRILLLDEPFAALDLEIRRALRAEIRSLLATLDLPIIMVTHDREEALALGDRIVVLDDGAVVAKGEPAAVLGRPRRERVARLAGVENLLRLRVEEVLPEEGVVRCTRGELGLDVPLFDASPGDEVTVGIRADDIILATSRPLGLSARNVLRGTVASVEGRGGLVAVVVDCSVPLTIHVTRGTAAELDLVAGRPLWIVVKSASCLVLGEDRALRSGAREATLSGDSSVR